MSLPAISHRFRRPPTRGGVIVVALALLTGCAEGDLGRIKSNLVIDGIHDWVGTDPTGSITPSRFQFTDDERELRDLGYPLIEAPFDRQRWYSILGEYGLNGIRNMPFDVTAYTRVLMTRPARSPVMRYQLLCEDVRNDIVRIGPFFRVAARVADMDGKRAQSLPYVTGLTEGELSNALKRITENQVAVGWVQFSLHRRVEAYRFALERLVIAVPSPLAVECEQQVNRLQREVDAVTLVAVTPQPRVHVSK
jgi:hypothetical protein